MQIFAAARDRRYSRPMILRARTVVTMDGPPIEDGGVVVSGNQIADAGKWPEIKARHAGETVDLGESVLLPGLINTHCHLEYTSLRGLIPRPQSFAGWIRAINAQKATLSDDDYVASIVAGFAEAQKFGTTSIANLEAFPHLLSRLPNAPLRTWWFAEMIDLRGAPPGAGLYEIARSELERRSDRLSAAGLAPHAPYTASPQLYAEAAEIARRKNVLVATHLAESREEMQMFRDGNGPLFDFMQSLGRPMDDCGRKTPLACVRSRTALDGRWIVAHLNELTEDDFLSLAQANKFHIAHCPRSHRYFGHTPFAFARLRDLGFNISLGTDSLASNEDLSLFNEMRAFAQNEPGVSAEEILSMVTLNPALALGQSHFLGRIRPQFCADLIAIPAGSSSKHLVDEIIACEGEVSFSMINGRVIHTQPG